MKKHISVSIRIALCAMPWLSAQAATPVPPPPPDSGALLQQNKPAPSITPSGANTGLILDQAINPAIPDSALFGVKRIDIDGNTLFETATLHALVSSAEGHEQTLAQLSEIVARITAFYHLHGYPLARAYLPAQTLHDGIIRVSIIEARYGQIGQLNTSLVSDEVLRGALSALRTGAPVEQSQLDRTLLLLSDIPGMIATSVIKPGQTVGTSELTVDAQATAAWTGNAVADNYGNRYTGRARFGGTFNWIDPLHLGDVLSVWATSTGNDMNTISLTYESLVSNEGTRAGVSLSTLNYKLGDSLFNIGGHGAADVSSFWIKTPWQRSRDVNVYSQLAIEDKKLNDEIDTAGIQTARHISSTSFSLNGDTRDAHFGDAVTTWSLAWKLGKLGFDNDAAQKLDASSARTEATFLKWSGSYARLQNFTSDTAVLVALSAQVSNNNLDSAEKMVAGGTYTVRAYDMGALSGDRGLLGSVELRQNLGNVGAGGVWQAVAFVDSEQLTVNQTSWVAGTNSAHLSGAGLGLNWNSGSRWYARVFVAAPIGAEPALVGQANKTRGWAEIGTWF